MCLLILTYMVVELSSHLSLVSCMLNETHSYFLGGNYVVGMSSPPTNKWLGLDNIITLSKDIKEKLPVSSQ